MGFVHENEEVQGRVEYNGVLQSRHTHLLTFVKQE